MHTLPILPDPGGWHPAHGARTRIGADNAAAPAATAGPWGRLSLLGAVWCGAFALEELRDRVEPGAQCSYPSSPRAATMRCVEVGDVRPAVLHLLQPGSV